MRELLRTMERKVILARWTKRCAGLHRQGGKKGEGGWILRVAAAAAVCNPAGFSVQRAFAAKNTPSTTRFRRNISLSFGW
jgi:hypothetical protein